MTTKILLDFAKSRPDLNFIFKTKPNTSQEEYQIIRKYNLNNCKLIIGGTSIDLIKNSDCIIAFNTTGIFEGMIMNKKIIVPNFQNGKVEKGFMFDLSKIVYQPKTKQQTPTKQQTITENKHKKAQVRPLRFGDLPEPARSALFFASFV